MRPLPALCFGALLALAGCATGPFGAPFVQERSVTVVANNSANATQTFEVWVVEGELRDEGITLHKRNGEVDSASPGQGLSSYRLDGDYGYVTSVEMPPDRSRLHGRYRLEPGETNRSTVGNFTTGSTLVVALSENGRVVELIAANCAGQALGALEVTSRSDPPGGASASYGCR